MVGCQACGAENLDAFRFCGSCGAPLPEAPQQVGQQAGKQAQQVRKVVTVLFVDVTGSTELGERVDPEAMRRAMGRYFAVARGFIERHGGTVEKFIGDAVMAVFGVPNVHEDDALRAVRAAAEIRDAMDALNEQLRREQGIQISVRIGVNTGEVVAGDDDSAQTLVTGDAVNTAARLEQAAAAGEILLGEATERVVRPHATVEPVAPLSLKGKQDLVAAYRLVGVAPPTASVTRRLEGPMVGRHDELQQLTAVLQRVIRERRCHLFTVIGGAGVGKSRLVREFVAGTGGEARVLRGRCLAYGDGVTYWPLVEIVREAAEIEAEDSAEAARAKVQALTRDSPDGERVAHTVSAAIGLSQESAGTDDIAWATRKLFEALASAQPLVVIVDDIQWGERALLDLIEDVASWSEGAPLMMVCMARPDLLDERRTWSGGLVNATTVLLEPLRAEESAVLISQLLGDAALDGSLGRRIVETAEGNPLFVEEMIGMLIDAGVLVADDSTRGWRLVGDTERVEVPPTIQALLAARLDRLPRQERVLAQRGSVIGRTFEREAVAHLSPGADRAQIVEGLRGLVRHQVIGPYQAEDVYRFRHLLIRDAAYDALPKEERANLHERFADWLEASAGDRVAEYEEILGYHLEQAHDSLQALGQRDHPRVLELAARAGRWLANAGERAGRRGDVSAAVGLLTRATRLLPQSHPSYWNARVELADVLENAGDVHGSLKVLRDVLHNASAVPGDVLSKARLYEAWTEHQLRRLPVAEARRMIGSQLRSLARSGYHATAAAAWRMMAGIYQDALDPRRAERAYRRAARYAARAGEAEAEATTLIGLANVASRGRTPVPDAMTTFEQALAKPGLTHSQRSRAQSGLAYLYAMQERFDEARELVTLALQDCADRGEREAIENHQLTFGLIEYFAGDLPAAEEHMRASWQESIREGTTEWGLFLAARLAHILMLQGKDDDALLMADRARPEQPEPWSDMLIASVRARITARRGDTSRAVAMARTMVERAEAAGFAEYPAILAPALEDLAEVLIADGQLDEARGVLERVLEMQRSKQNLAGVRKATRALDLLAQRAASAT